MRRRKVQGERRKTEMQPLVFGCGHLLHSRDCENGRRECVCVWLRVCVCVCQPHVYVLLSLEEKEGG